MSNEEPKKKPLAELHGEFEAGEPADPADLNGPPETEADFIKAITKRYFRENPPKLG